MTTPGKTPRLNSINIMEHRVDARTPQNQSQLQCSKLWPSSLSGHQMAATPHQEWHRMIRNCYRIYQGSQLYMLWPDTPITLDYESPSPDCCPAIHSFIKHLHSPRIDVALISRLPREIVRPETRATSGFPNTQTPRERTALTSCW